jgi:hypothetical protein
MHSLLQLHRDHEPCGFAEWLQLSLVLSICDASDLFVPVNSKDFNKNQMIAHTIDDSVCVLVTSHSVLQAGLVQRGSCTC